MFDSAFIEKIEDRDGQVIFDYEQEKFNHAEQVIDEKSAFLMAHLMKGVVERGTGWRIRELKRPAAGKTGTSNDLMDAWFIGYTPDRVAGVWVGFDLKKTIGNKETGGRVSSPIWLNFMKPYLEQMEVKQYQQLVEEAQLEAEQLGLEYEAPAELEPIDFRVPPGVDPMYVDKMSGYQTTADDPNAIYEYLYLGQSLHAQLTRRLLPLILIVLNYSSYWRFLKQRWEKCFLFSEKVFWQKKMK